MMRRIPVAFGVVTLAFVLFAQAADPQPNKAKIEEQAPPAVLQGDALLAQEKLSQSFKEFTARLLLLAQQMESSSKEEDREKAKILREAIKLANETGVNVRFTQVIDLLKKSKAASNLEVQQAIDQGDQLAKQLHEIYLLLLTDSRDKQRKDEIERIQNLLKELNRIIRDQKIVQAQTERKMLDPDALAKAQAEVTKLTEKLAGLQGNNKGNQGAEGKGESKGEGKNKGAGRGEGKEDTNKPKGEGHEGKPGAGKPGEGKPGEGKPGEGKPGEGKPGEGKPGEGKPGEGKPGEGKPGEGKPGEGKPGEGKPGEGKPGEGKPGEGKPGEGKPGEGKPGEGKPGEGKPGEGKPGEGKPGEGKPGEGKPGEGKPGEGKPSQAKPREQGKGEAKPGSDSGKPSEGKPGEGKPGSGKPGEGQPGEAKSGGQSNPNDSKNPPSAQKGPPKSGPPQQPKRPGQQQIEEAIPHQEKAEKGIEKNDTPGAADQQAQAVQKLEEARRRLEEILKQLREEEVLRTLADLQRRCEYMLAMQKEVYEGTVRLDKSIGENPEKKKTRADEQKSQALADREGQIAKEASFAENLVRSEGTVVAFAEAFTQLVEDMKFVQKNLNKTEVALPTQKVELDIIQSLEEMIEALKKAQQQAKAQQGQGQGQPGKPGNQKLVDLVAELKMVRFMQLKINKQTTDSSESYPDEQAEADDIKDRLKNLSDRQDRVKKILNDIATGKNQ